MNKQKILKKKYKKANPFAVVHIKTTFNNTIITISDIIGNVICSASSGSTGAKGARKATAFAAQMAAKEAAHKALDMGVNKVAICINGRGKGRESTIRAIKNEGLTILSLEDTTKFPFNGCRPPKRRRL